MVKEFFKELIPHGYKCFLVDRKDFDYGFTITPSDNVMYIEYSNIYGWHVCFEYKPSKNNGSSCSTAGRVSSIDFETLCEIEQNCKSYALSLGATLYKSSSEWYNKYWNKDSLIEIT